MNPNTVLLSLHMHVRSSTLSLTPALKAAAVRQLQLRI